MKRIITSVLAGAVITGVLWAQSVNESYFQLPGVKQHGPVVTRISDISKAAKPRAEIRKPEEKMRKHASRAEENLVKVTFKFPNIGAGGEWEMPWGEIRVYNEGDYYEEFIIEPFDEDFELIPLSEIEVEVQAGLCDALCIFQHRNPNCFQGYDPYVYYIAEDAEMKEGAVIELKPEESTICLEMATVNPDGKETQFGKGYYDADWNWNVVNDGDIYDDYMIKQVFKDGDMVEALQINSGSFEVVDSPIGSYNPATSRNFYVNKVSDRYTFRVSHMMPSYPEMLNGVYLAATEAVGSVEGKYLNSSDYTFEDSKILNTPASKEYPVSNSIEEEIQAYHLAQWANKIGIAYSLAWNSSDIWEVWSSGVAGSKDKDLQYYSYDKSLEDMLAIFEEEFDDEIWKYQLTFETKAPKIFPFANGGSGAVCQFPHGWLSVGINGREPAARYPGNPGFLSELSKTKLESGGSAPLLTSYMRYDYNWSGDDFIKYLSFSYTGRVGEYIESDAFLATGSLSVNGDVVVESPAEFSSWMRNNPDVNGKYEAVIETDNFEIEGIKGGNKAFVTFTKGGEDPFPPSATMLQLRNAIDEVVQVFNTPNDGVLLLTAADFEVQYGEPNWEGFIPTSYICSKPAKVSVSVSPTGVVTDAFEEIELTEVPEYFAERGFGAFYRGSLAAVSAQSPTGWFDMTITVEDEAGNRQVQTLSPAFKIESLSGVENVAYKGVQVIGNNIVVEGDAIIYNIAGQRVSGRNLPTGVYFVVLPERTLKLFVR